MNIPRLKVGAWFKTNEGENLEVVAYDAEDGSIEVQFYDGTIEEYDFEDWEALEARSIAPPEDWAGSYDIGKDDYGVDLDKPAGDTHINPLDQLDNEE
ncbi:MAG: membrane protein [Gammaproteobacteria bacterium (ex Lamellibrachia satsuma)]|nr:MAG: hypothetical protein HPY30_07965 [Gammaproteobacteria bacterium (ex Lamellibrachia satsuma)]RRS33651.1 MAG: membrane protein [Gammaproteobacteria bacterium (ex Lamellibrachia satsuma)]RRS37088.1 MAG: membrane protein [Gammaproteobacteria bacterium (ex Lamellibrachia satsuma)]